MAIHVLNRGVKASIPPRRGLHRGAARAPLDGVSAGPMRALSWCRTTKQRSKHINSLFRLRSLAKRIHSRGRDQEDECEILRSARKATYFPCIL